MDTGTICISVMIWLSGGVIAVWMAKELAHIEVERRFKEVVIVDPVKYIGRDHR